MQANYSGSLRTCGERGDQLRWVTTSTAVVQSDAIAACASASDAFRRQTSWISRNSTSSFGFGEACGSTHRLRGSLGSPPSASGIR